MRTNIKTIHFKSSNGADTVSAALYYPDARPVRAVLLISHGMCEHIGRYHEFMLSMAHEGFAVFGHDHLGHGKTAPDEGKRGFFAPKNGYRYLIRDVFQLGQVAAGMFPGVPRYLIGHSMGSLVARLYCIKYPGTIHGVVLIGTPGPNPMAGAGLLLAQRYIRREGPFSRPELLDRMTLGRMNRSFIPARTGKDWLTRDEAAVDKNLADPLNNFVFTASGFADLYTMMEVANSQKWVRDYPKDLPTLILSGDCDPVGNFGKGVLQVYNRLVGAGVEDLTFQLYEGARHELLNEINRDEVCADLLAWLNEHVALAGSLAGEMPASGDYPGEDAAF